MTVPLAVANKVPLVVVRKVPLSAAAASASRYAAEQRNAVQAANAMQCIHTGDMGEENSLISCRN